MTGDMDSMRFNHLLACRPNLCLNATTPLTSIEDWCHRTIALLRPALIRRPVFAHQVSFWDNFSTSGAVNKQVGAKGPRHCQPALRKKCVTNLPLAALLRERKGALDRQLPRSFLALYLRKQTWLVCYKAADNSVRRLYVIFNARKHADPGRDQV